MAIAWLVSSCLGVFVHDAFTRDWIKHHFGAVSRVLPLSSSLVIGVSDTHTFLAGADGVKWAIEDAVDTIASSGDKHFAVSGRKVYVVDENSGTYVGSFSGAPSKIAATAHGVFAVVNGDVEVVSQHQKVTRLLYEQRVSDFALTSVNGITYVLANDGNVVAYDGEPKHIGKIPLRSTVDAKDGVVATNDRIVFFPSLDSINFKADVVVSREYVATVRGAEISLYKLTQLPKKVWSVDLKEKIKSVTAPDYALSSLLVVETSSTNVFDLTDFLSTDDSDTITQVTAEPGAVLQNNNAQLEVVSVQSTLTGYNVSSYDIAQNVTSVTSIDIDSRVPVKAILIDKARSLQSIDKAHHVSEDAYTLAVFTRWFTRTKRHLAELGRWVTSKEGNAETEDAYGVAKLLVYVDALGDIVAVDTATSETVWVQSALGSVQEWYAVGGQLHIVGEPNAVLDVRDGSIVSSEILAITDRAPGYYVEHDDRHVQAYKVENGLKPTWNFKGPIHAVASRPEDSATASVGIARSDKSVLYKFLYQNGVAVVTSENDQLVVYLFDGITGEVLWSQWHHDEEVDFSSVRIATEDNWIVYTYFTKAPRAEQRIVVVDLFSDVAPSGIEASVFGEFNTTIGQVSTKSFIFPEKILAIEPTRTKYGITIKALVVFTETGSLVEIPKFILNSRRIDDRPVTPADYQDDYRLQPYVPVIDKSTYQVLNHKHKLPVGQNNQVLVKPTELESTAVVCLVNQFVEFCTLVQPSLSYDTLSANFDKVKLLLTIVILLAGYLITKPMVYNRKLQKGWVDQ